MISSLFATKSLKNLLDEAPLRSSGYKRTLTRLSRPFRTPWVPLVPALGAIICLLQMFSLPVNTWLRLAGWLAIGIAVYFTYGISNSVLRKGKSE